MVIDTLKHILNSSMFFSFVFLEFIVLESKTRDGKWQTTDEKSSTSYILWLYFPHKVTCNSISVPALWNETSRLDFAHSISRHHWFIVNYSHCVVSYCGKVSAECSSLFLDWLIDHFNFFNDIAIFNDPKTYEYKISRQCF